MRTPCWYCPVVTVDFCPQCGSSTKEREEIAAFYESFNTFSVTEDSGEIQQVDETKQISRRPT